MDNKRRYEMMNIAHASIKAKWEQLRDDLQQYKYAALAESSEKKSKFLSEFDSFFREGNVQNKFVKSIDQVFRECTVIRGAIVDPDVSDVPATRFIPQSDKIKSCNRFSPKGVEWLYLSLSNTKDKDRFQRACACSIAELRCKSGDRFASCEFELVKSNLHVVDLTLGDDWSWDAQTAAIRKLVDTYKRSGNPYSKIYNDPEVIRNIVSCYTNILSEELFLPVKCSDKEYEYAPFHCIAYYFKSYGYSGIIYKSTVYSEGKNMVLFDKNIAAPIDSSIKVRTINL